MRIIIEDDKEIELTTDNLDNNNFVTLMFNDDEAILSIEELYSAVKSFYEMRTRNKRYEKLL